MRSLRTWSARSLDASKGHSEPRGDTRTAAASAPVQAWPPTTASLLAGAGRAGRVGVAELRRWAHDEVSGQADPDCTVRGRGVAAQGCALEGLRSPSVQFEGVGRVFDGRRVLDNVTLRLPGGTTTALMGTSGCGKTVLARLLAGELRPSEGRILVADQPIWQGPVERWAQVPRSFGLLLGSNKSYDMHIDRSLSVVDNLLGVLMRIEPEREIAERRAREFAREWDLDAVADMPVRDLESLARHRLCLAQALVGDPPLVVIDDPSWAVDINHVDDEVRLIRKWQSRTGGTILLTTHSIMFARALADQIVVMHSGWLADAGPTGTLLAGVSDDKSFERRFKARLSVRESDVERLRALGTDDVRWGGHYLDIARPMRHESRRGAADSGPASS